MNHEAKKLTFFKWYEGREPFLNFLISFTKKIRCAHVNRSVNDKLCNNVSWLREIVKKAIN